MQRRRASHRKRIGGGRGSELGRTSGETAYRQPHESRASSPPTTLHLEGKCNVQTDYARQPVLRRWREGAFFAAMTKICAARILNSPSESSKAQPNSSAGTQEKKSA